MLAPRAERRFGATGTPFALLGDDRKIAFFNSFAAWRGSGVFFVDVL
jgi:hypothetical protein